LIVDPPPESRENVGFAGGAGAHSTLDLLRFVVNMNDSTRLGQSRFVNDWNRVEILIFT